MSIGTKLKTVYDGCSDIRAAIKEKDSTKGSGAIGTLANDISTLYPDSVITKIYQDDTTGEYGMVQYESTANSATSTVLTTNVPEGVTVKTIILPQTVTSIAADSFKSNTGLEYINLENITSIGIGAFRLSGLTMPLNLPNLTSIGKIAFRGANISKIESLGNITSIPNDSNGTNGGCFASNTNLEEVVLPDSLTMLGSYAFYSCTKLKTVTFPNHTISFGNGQTGQRGQFENCTSLIDIGQPQISRFSGYRSFYHCTSLVTADLSLCTFTGTYNPDSYANGTFNGCTKLQTVILPSTCTNIGSGSFYGCSALTTMSGWDNVTTIYTRALQGAKLSGIFNLQNLTTIASFACVGCKFTQIILPAIVSTAGTSSTNSGSFSNITTLTYAEFGPNCTTIGQGTFQNCSALNTFVCRAETPPTLGASVFTNTNSALKIYVPYSADQSIINAYKAASNWSAQSSKIYELNEDGTVPTA